MRLQKTTSIALAAGLALGGVGAATAAFAADHEPATQTVQAPSPALPGAEQVAKQNRVLGNTGEAIKPVTELVRDVLRTTDGNLSQEAAQKHSTAVQQALAKIRKQAQQTGEQGTEQDQARESGALVGEEAAGEQAAGKTTLKAVDQLNDRVDELLDASTSGEPAKVNTELEKTVTATVNLMTSVVTSDALPDADMPELSQQPGEVGDQDSSEDQQSDNEGAPKG